MGRPLRRHAPNTDYLFSTRCHQARFFLRPDRTLNQVVLEWVARAEQAYPDIHVYAFCVMSNHLHVLLRDTHGELAGWAHYFLGNLARSVNRVRNHRRGVVFERRYSAEPVLDHAALVDRFLYVITNPVKADLCDRHERWPGLVLWARSGACESHEVSWLDRKAYRRARDRARRRGEAPPDANDFLLRGTFTLHPLPAECSTGSQTQPGLAEAIEARERELVAARKRAGRRSMSRAKVLSQDWHAAPRHPKRSPRPLCHTSDPSLFRDFVASFRAFVAAFREASAEWRSGKRNVTFPPWSYPPGLCLVRVVQPVPG